MTMNEKPTLPRFGFGGAPVGNLVKPVTDGVATALLDRAWEHGLRYFDTAPHYGHGLSEHRIGRALRNRPPDDYILSSKVGRLLTPDPLAERAQHKFVDVLPFTQRWDYSFDATLRSIEDSLQRLGLARLDIVYVHDLARHAHGDQFDRQFAAAMDGAMRALERLRAEGTIAGFGLGVNEWEVCVQALAHCDMDVLLLAGRYTLADQTALPVLLPQCLDRRLQVVIGGPFNSGILASGAAPAGGGAPFFNWQAAPEHLLSRVAAIEAVCADHRLPLKAAALQFPLAHPAVACVIPGVRTVDELDENLSLMARPIPHDFWRELRDKHLIAPESPIPGEQHAAAASSQR